MSQPIFLEEDPRSAAAVGLTLEGTPNNDVLFGSADDDIMRGLDGNDALHGLGGNDVLYGNAGHDSLLGDDGNDHLLGGAGSDWLNGGIGNDQIEGGADSDSLEGGDGDDWLDGGAGKDTLNGGNGADIYVFGRGSGRDAIGDTSGANRILFGADLALGDVIVSRNMSDLVFTIRGTEDQLRVVNYFSFGDVFKAEFGDGTIWGKADFLAHISTSSTEGDDFLSGTSGNDVLNGLGGDDTLVDDAGNDILDGGSGDDELVGGNGNDIYIFGRGYGHDRVVDYQWSTDFDKVKLAAGIATSDVTLTQNGADLILSINGTTDQLQISTHFGGSPSPLGGIEFADGTFWNANDILLHLQVSNGDDHIVGTAGDDVLDGMGGDDTLYGGGGNDHLIGRRGVDILYGGDGNDRLNGGAGDDVLYSGNGNDSMTGGDGGDSFVFDTPVGVFVDQIVDYAIADDIILLENAVFTKLATNGVLNANFFVASASGDAVDANDYILYETDTGKIFYDADGSGAGAKVQFAVVGGDTHPLLTASEFWVI